MGAQRRRNPRRILSEVEQEEWEQQIQKEEERMREEREQHVVRVSTLTKERRRIRNAIRCRQAKMKRAVADENHRKKGVARRQSDEETRKLDVESRLHTKAPPPGRPKQNMSEEERRVREKWEQRIQEEEEKMREEREQKVYGSNLTKEQKRIRSIISHRARHLRARTQREAEDERNRQETVGQRQSDDETETFTQGQGRQKRVLSEEERRLRTEQEQAEEKLMREDSGYSVVQATHRPTKERPEQDWSEKP